MQWLTLAPDVLAEQIRAESRALDANVLLLDVETLEDHLSGSAFFPARIAAGLVSVFGVLGLTLALVGLYGLLAHSVSRQTQEIGVRMAMGATSTDVLGMILKSGLRLTLAGIAVGLVGSLVMSRMLASLLYDVSTTDALTYLGVPFLLVVVALISCWIPARRATRIDPLKRAALPVRTLRSRCRRRRTYEPSQGDKHLSVTVTVIDGSSNPVSGASVSIELFRDNNLFGTFTGTTGASGQVTFTEKNAPSGCYTTSVTDVTASDLSWDGLTPVNGRCK